jgi:DNA-binding GntR family transcriptional regulator
VTGVSRYLGGKVAALLAADPSELFDLGLVLECDAARLMAASLEPKLLSVAAAALEARLEEAWKAEVAE